MLSGLDQRLEDLAIAGFTTVGGSESGLGDVAQELWDLALRNDQVATRDGAREA